MPNVKTPSVGVRVREPPAGAAVGVNVDAGFAEPSVAVTGVVVRLGWGVLVSVLVGTLVAEASPIMEVAVSTTGTIVGEG